MRLRFAATVSKIMALAPQAEIAAISATELAFRLHGLELARVRLANAPGTFQVTEEIIFGPPGYETRLNDETEPAFAEFIKTVVEARRPNGDRRDPLWRMYPERWLESLIFKNISAVDSSLNRAHVYSQVPAFSASDRAMIDVLTCTRDARLAVLELKADEDMHLPLQGLDYWARVLWHHSRGEFQQHGYFPAFSSPSATIADADCAIPYRVLRSECLAVLLSRGDDGVDHVRGNADVVHQDGVRIPSRPR